jgi:hypothetical protein
MTLITGIRSLPYDLLTKQFGPEATRKIIDAPVSLHANEVMCS